MWWASCGVTVTLALHHHVRRRGARRPGSSPSKYDDTALSLSVVPRPTLGRVAPWVSPSFQLTALVEDVHPSGDVEYGYETFLPKGKGILIDENGVSQYELAIFDKFGSIIFRTDSIDPRDGSPVVGWDGTKNGEPLPQGTYVWKIYAQFSDGTYWDGTGLGYGKASEDGDNDPWIERKQTGLRSGAVYLIR